ncbi:MAG TPA: protein kinase [Thermoanaerobaculia bacterium]|nr:protein kinase [Thermoanaerobaculia bacterium]
MTLAAGVRVGPYEVVGPLGAGGMGEVYRARDERLSRDVALKVLPGEISDDRTRLERFEKEARAASSLNHPNIVTVYDIGSSESIAYIAMELVEGRTLRELLIPGAIPLKRMLLIAAQAADGLAKAHSAGIVHRDLKPENLMVTKDGFVKILDFGLAKLVPAGFEKSDGSNLATVTRGTEPGAVLGTVGYMSPEQASGHPVDFRSDQFSLGAILYEMASGNRAFHRETPVQTLSAIIGDDPEPLSTAAPKIPANVAWIAERCLAKDPEDRYASTRDLARDLAGIRDRVSGISSPGETPLVSPARRRRLSPAIAAAIIVASGLLAAAAVWRLLPARSSPAPRFQQLTFRRGSLNNARFGPDGRTVLYGATWAGETLRLYATRTSSSESWAPQIGEGDWDIVAVSPSGELAVLRLSDGMLARVPLAGGTPRPVVKGVPYASADWSPDGKDLAVVRQVNRRYRLEYPVGKVLRESVAELACPRFSPKGDRIAYFQSVGHTNSIVVMDSSGKESRTVSEGWSEVDGAPCWTSEREIWFTATRPGAGGGLHAVDLSGKLRLVTRVPGSIELDDVSRDGRALVGHHAILNTLMGRIVGDAKDRDFSWLDLSVATGLSDDGKTILFLEYGEAVGGNAVAFLRKTDGSPPVRLGEGRPLALSPDGSTVLACVDPPGAAPRLVLLPTGPGEAKTLPNVLFDTIQTGEWLPDGRAIVFSARQKERPPRVYFLDLQTGKSRPLTPEGFRIHALSRSVSPDGRLVLVGADDDKQFLFPIEGGDPRPVAGLEPGDRPFQWTSDGRSLYVYRQAVPVKVWLVDPTTGARRLFKELTPAEPVEKVLYLFITPDGQSYVYGHRRFLSSLYAIEGLP